MYQYQYLYLFITVKIFFTSKCCAYQVIAAVVRSAFLEAWQLQSTACCVAASSVSVGGACCSCNG